ncbi:hypothetical protein WAI453_003361 [Rhynchosporium graminicola]|uniref:Uncharacterized protein n=1 Tax=Rhynchosporium graminicola TaxID=2792576 RepID=A0A1E1KPV6_9HELO|nr:uncharacterized protein RCO7_11617 [Rhynchosporium commune]
MAAKETVVSEVMSNAQQRVATEIAAVKETTTETAGTRTLQQPEPAYATPGDRDSESSHHQPTFNERRSTTNNHRSGPIVDEIPASDSNFLGSEILWAATCISLCLVSTTVIAFFYTENFAWVLASSTVLRVVSLFAGMAPVLLYQSIFRIQGRLAFVLFCLSSLASVFIAWSIWLAHVPKWPKVYLTISDVFMVLATVQMSLSGAGSHPTREEDTAMTTNVH